LDGRIVTLTSNNLHKAKKDKAILMHINGKEKFPQKSIN
jgi:hypothetical protein